MKLHAPTTTILITLIFVAQANPTLPLYKSTMTPEGINKNSQDLFERAAVFRFENFSDKVFLNDQTQLHKAIAVSRAKNNDLVEYLKSQVEVMDIY